MGLTIHYSGRFNEQASLSEMIEEVKDIAEIYNWKYRILEQHFCIDELGKTEYNNKIYGICFTPPECETINLCFLSNGRMSSAPNLEFFGNSTDKDYQKYLYMLSVKTQFAGSATHKLIIHLLKYLNKKYFSEFKVIDEGNYWDTGDEKILEETFEKYTALLDSFGAALETIPLKSEETFEDYFKRIMQIIQNKRKK